MPRVTEAFVLSNLGSAATGIDGAVVWVSAGEFSDGGHDIGRGPRLLVVVGDDISLGQLEHSVAVLLTDPPEVLGILPSKVEQQVLRLAQANRGVLIAYWNQEMSTREMLELIHRVKPGP